MFQKLTVTTRLVTGFAVVIAMLVAVAILGLVNLSGIAQQVGVLADQRMPQVIAAGQWEAAVLRSARHMETVFVLTDQDEVRKELGAVRENREQQAKLLAQMKQSAASGEVRALVEAIEKAHTAYAESEGEFIQLANDARIDEAKITLLVKAKPAQRAYVDAIAKLSGQVQAEARAMSRASEESYRNGLVAVAIASLLCVGAGVFVAMMLSRGLREELGGEPAYATSVVKQVAGGDLTVDVWLERGDRTSLLHAMREMVENLRDAVGETARGAHAVADTSAQIAQGNLDLSQRTEEQASTLQDTAASMEELTSTVARNAQTARQASQLAADASATAQKGGEVVDDVVNTMDEILDASKKISDIIGVIDGIAFQTNILALNAAVEAARAGEQGRGFAVVASEVRSLAHRTTVAAKEIKALIGDSTNKVQAGASRVDAAGHTMVGVVMSVQKVSELIAEIAAASQAQSARIGQVSGGVLQMDRVVQQNASLVEEAAAATESMKEQAETLLRIVSRFRVDGSEELEDDALYAADDDDEERHSGFAASSTYADDEDGEAEAPPFYDPPMVENSRPAPIEVRPSRKLPAPYLAAITKGLRRGRPGTRR